MVRRVLAAAALTALLAGCSSIVDGTTQTLSVNSYPPDAKCTLLRNGLIIGSLRTPSGIVVEKTKHAIQVTCSKEGYEDAITIVKSGTAGATWGNAATGLVTLGGGLVGWAVDSAKGADNKYDDVVTVNLPPRKDYKPPPPPPPAGMYYGG